MLLLRSKNYFTYWMIKQVENSGATIQAISVGATQRGSSNRGWRRPSWKEAASGGRPSQILGGKLWYRLCVPWGSSALWMHYVSQKGGLLANEQPRGGGAGWGQVHIVLYRDKFWLSSAHFCCCGLMVSLRRAAAKTHAVWCYLDLIMLLQEYYHVCDYSCLWLFLFCHLIQQFP